MNKPVLPPLSNTQEAAEMLAKRAMLGRGLRRVKEAAGVMGTLQDWGTQAKDWTLDPEHMSTRVPLVGAGIGGLLGLASSFGRRKEERQPFRSALTGAIAGGALGLGGVGAKGLYDRYQEGVEPKPTTEEAAAAKKVTEYEQGPADLAKAQGWGSPTGLATLTGGAVLAGDTALLGKQRAAGRAQIAGVPGGAAPLDEADKALVTGIQKEGPTIAGRPLQSPIYQAKTVKPEALIRLQRLAPDIIQTDVLNGKAIPKLERVLAEAQALASAGGTGGRAEDLAVGSVRSQFAQGKVREIQEQLWHLNPRHAEARKPAAVAGQSVREWFAGTHSPIQSRTARRSLLGARTRSPVPTGLKNRMRLGRLPGVKGGLTAAALAALVYWATQGKNKATVAAGGTE